MKAPTLTIDQQADAHFLTRMHEATAGERDAVLADLAATALAGDELAERTIRVLVLPACERIAAAKANREDLVPALVDAAYEEVIDWAVREGHATR
jgi:hypothetical protein